MRTVRAIPGSRANLCHLNALSPQPLLQGSQIILMDCPTHGLERTQRVQVIVFPCAPVGRVWSQNLQVLAASERDQRVLSAPSG